MTEAQRERLRLLAIKSILKETTVENSLIFACAREVLEGDGNMTAKQWMERAQAVWDHVRDVMGPP